MEKRKNHNLEFSLTVADLFFIPSSMYRLIRKSDKKGELTNRTLTYIGVIAGEMGRLNLYYQLFNSLSQ